MMLLPDEAGAILKVTIEKINLGMAYQRKYHVRYSSGAERTYGIPPETVMKFIKANRREMSKVSFIFTDRSDAE